jgi:uncharacterized protein with HEPN domain
MKGDKRSYSLFLEDIRESMELIVSYLKEIDYTSFAKDRKTIDAVFVILKLLAKRQKKFLRTLRRNILKYHGMKCIGCEI